MKKKEHVHGINLVFLLKSSSSMKEESEIEIKTFILSICTK